MTPVIAAPGVPAVDQLVHLSHPRTPTELVGAENCVTSCDMGVLVVEAVEPVSPQDRDLVPEHENLRVLRGVISRQEHQPAENPDHDEVNETDEHDRRA